MDLPLGLTEFSSTTILITLVCNSISILACLAFVLCFIRMPQKSFTLQLILILCLGDMTFHFAVIVFYSCKTPSVLHFTFDLLMVMTRFTIFWACNIAILLYKLLRMHKIANLQAYRNYTVAILLILSIGFELIMRLLDTHFKLAVYTTIYVPVTITIALTLFFYCKTASMLRHYSTIIPGSSSVNPNKLYMYCFAQLFVVVPSLIYFAIEIGANTTPLAIQILLSLSLGLAGFINTSVYFFYREKSLKQNYSTMDSPEDLSACFSDYGDQQNLGLDYDQESYL